MGLSWLWACGRAFTCAWRCARPTTRVLLVLHDSIVVAGLTTHNAVVGLGACVRVGVQVRAVSDVGLTMCAVAASRRWAVCPCSRWWYGCWRVRRVECDPMLVRGRYSGLSARCPRGTGAGSGYVALGGQGLEDMGRRCRCAAAGALCARFVRVCRSGGGDPPPLACRRQIARVGHSCMWGRLHLETI
jgi:hypothetical protein